MTCEFLMILNLQPDDLMPSYFIRQSHIRTLEILFYKPLQIPTQPIQFHFRMIVECPRFSADRTMSKTLTVWKGKKYYSPSIDKNSTCQFGLHFELKSEMLACILCTCYLLLYHGKWDGLSVTYVARVGYRFSTGMTLALTVLGCCCQALGMVFPWSGFLIGSNNDTWPSKTFSTYSKSTVFSLHETFLLLSVEFL